MLSLTRNSQVRDPRRVVVRRCYVQVAVLLSTVVSAGVFLESQVEAAESQDAFLEGLKQRGYFDTALEYLDQLGQVATTTDDVRATLGIERASIHMAQGKAARRQDDRDRFVKLARVAVEKFLREYPQHRRVAEAQVQIGNIVLAEARRQIWNLNPTGGSGGDAVTAREARRQLVSARELFKSASDGFKVQLDTLPFVDAAEDKAAWEHRRRIEARHLAAWLSVVSCVYEEALTLDKSSGRRERLLEDAIEELTQINTFSRASAAGLHAQLMLGKCWHELGDISQALGFFDQLRNQTSRDAYIQQLAYTAEHYRLICFNHESRKDYQLVVTEASRWLGDHRDVQNTEAGLGILFEKAVASEALARADDVTDEERQLRLRVALADLEIAGAVMSPVQQPALAAVRRLREELGESRGEPGDFDSAFDRGREMIRQLQQAGEAVTEATSDKLRQQAEQQRDLLTAECGRMFQLALRLRKPNSDRSAVAQARYLLSYVYLQQSKEYDAFVLAREVMRRHRDDSPDTAADATEMAISAAVRIWASAPKDDRVFEMNLVKAICEEVIGAFPGSQRATDARMRLGRIYLDLNNPAEAARTFLQVPEGDDGFADAQIEAGQAWWLAWAQASSGPTDSSVESVSKETLQDWKTRARNLLEEGIRLGRSRQPGDRITDAVVRAEVSLCGILNQDGEFAETVRRLTEGDRSVIEAIESDEMRPERGVRSVPFAGLCYRTLLRAYVGTQDIDAALDVMTRLRKLGPVKTAPIYTQLGRELQKELRRLKDSGDTDRLQKVRDSFEQFLTQVYDSRDTSDSAALLWIGETYAGLAAGTPDSPEASRAWEQAATIYQELLQSDIDEPTAAAVKGKLIRVQRHRQEFAAAVQLATESLQENPVSVTIQLEAAHVLADWGEHGEPERLLESIGGLPSDTSEKTIWGWAMLARRLQNSRQQQDQGELRTVLLEARYELSRSRLRYAQVTPGGDRKQLQAAAQEVASMVRVLQESEESWWQKFNELYRDIQTGLGEPVAALPRPGSTSVPAEKQPLENTPVAQPNTAKKSPEPVEAPTDGTWYVLGIALIAVLVAVTCFLVMRQPGRRTRHRVRDEPERFTLPGNSHPASPTEPGTRQKKSGRTSRRSTASGKRQFAAGSQKKRPTQRPAPTEDDVNPRPPRRKKRPPPTPDA